MVFKDQYKIQLVQKMVQCTRIWYMNLRREVRVESLSTIFLVYKDYLNLEKGNLFFLTPNWDNIIYKKHYWKNSLNINYARWYTCYYIPLALWLQTFIGPRFLPSSSSFSWSSSSNFSWDSSWEM